MKLKSTLIITSFLFVTILKAQPITSTQVDTLVMRTLETFKVPGIAVAIVKDGKVIHAKGYGVRSLEKGGKVDEYTLFGIASNSKAFTSAALAILIDDGKLKWDDKVIDFIPEFRMYDPYVTASFTIRDLLTHRSGLGLGAGDLMIWPDSNDFETADIIHNLRYLKPVSEFRTKFDYDNLLYIVAGEVVARVSGKNWEDFVEERIIRPLGMDHTAAAYSRLKDRSNVIDPHAPVEDVVKVVPRDGLEFGNAAGGIYSNVTDLSKWVIMQMDNGKYSDGKKQIFSTEVHDEMWTPQTIIPVRTTNKYNTHYSSYGLGWFLSDVKGYKQVGHSGALAGMVTQVTLIPELKLGIIVLTNQQSGAAFTAITNQIKDSYLGVQGIDRVKEQSDREKAGMNNADKVTGEIWKTISEEQKKPSSKRDLSIYAGTYHDAWFGDVTISIKNNKLWFDAKRAPRFTGEMFFYKGNTFVAKWNERSFDADAFIMFGLDAEGKPSSIKMKPISPLTDFSFDFQDLDFSRKEP